MIRVSVFCPATEGASFADVADDTTIASVLQTSELVG